ncbi:MAG TPA: EGF domain-containing protein [bacterium]|nr:EGF domain-containing protein [bacterium]
MKRCGIFFSLVFIFISCVTDDPAAECITALDCIDGKVCVDGQCIDETGDTGNTGNTGDTGNTGNTGNSGDPDVIFADPDIVDDGDSAADIDSAIDVDYDFDEDADEITENDQDIFNDEDADEDIICLDGFEKDGSGKCVDINECTEGTHNCVMNATCTNTEGSFDCDCNSYYDGNGMVACTFCNTDAKCGASCSLCNGGTPKCKDYLNRTSVCVQCVENGNCATGYECLTNACSDINECSTNNGGCQHNCVNTGGNYYCTCNSGYALNPNNHTCDDINECSLNANLCKENGDSNAQCVNGTGNYSCNCSGGFSFNGTSCVDVNECTVPSHNCVANASCTNSTGSFSCACNSYYTGTGNVSCTFCNTDGQCGAACTSCGGGTPKCKTTGATTACVECIDDSNCAGGNVCNLSTNVCVAPIPAESCANGSQNRRGCGNARIIGRSIAKTSSGFAISADTCSASNDHDLPSSDECWDANSDHSYRIYIRAGESVAIQLTTGDPCSYSVSDWDATLKLYTNITVCNNENKNEYDYCKIYITSTHNKTFTATVDTWLYIIVDGSSAFDDEGDYSLNVKLQNCTTAGCNCP